jgi:hypothetical protein
VLNAGVGAGFREGGVGGRVGATFAWLKRSGVPKSLLSPPFWLVGRCRSALESKRGPHGCRNGVLILVRSALIALDQANKTGNYTVLRDLGARRSRRIARLGKSLQDFALTLLISQASRCLIRD